MPEETRQDYDAPRPPARRRFWRRLRWLGFGLALLCFLFFAGQLLRYQLTAQQTQSQVAVLKEIRAVAAAELPPDEPEAARRSLEALQAQNAELVGWLTVEGTRIDYPVMQSGESNPERYLRRNFYGEYDINGTPFLDARCKLDPASDNLVIYGHNMNSGIMFHDLLEYREHSFWDEHPYITLETLAGTATYQVFAAFLFDAGGDPKSFQPHGRVDYSTPEEFSAYLREILRRSYYETGVEVQYGDQILTLATCDKRSLSQGRMIVTAKLVEAPEMPAGAEDSQT